MAKKKTSSIPGAKSDVITRVIGATVMVEVLKKDDSNSLGTGVIVWDGNFVITAGHVLTDAKKVTLRKPNGLTVESDGWFKDGGIFKKEQDGRDVSVWPLDVGIIKLKAKFENYLHAIIEPSGAEIGDEVAFIGYAGGGLNFSTQDTTYSAIPLMTRGIVAAAVYHEYPGGVGDFWLIIDRPSFPGCSGGPVFSLKTGKIVGIISATPYMPTKIRIQGEAIEAHIPNGYAIAFGLRMATELLNKLTASLRSSAQ